MAAHRARGREKQIRSRFRAVESPSRNRTRSGRCVLSTYTLPKECRGGSRLRSQQERQARAQTRPTRRSTYRDRKCRAKRESAVAACRQFASRVAFLRLPENDSPTLIRAGQRAGRVAVQQRETQPRKQNPAAAK